MAHENAPGESRYFWREQLAPYARPDARRSAIDVVTSIVAYLAMWPLLVWSYDVSYLLTLALTVPASGFLLRTFIVFHDCTHGSFLPSRKWNDRLGVFAGLLVYHPFRNWRHHHAIHHGSAGDLDRRGTGDVPTMTINEYNSKGWLGRLGYRLFRSPFVMFTIGPLWSLVIGPRLIGKHESNANKRSVHLTNLALAVVITGVCLLIGWQEFLLIQLPMVFQAGTAGVWLFYVQHNFEDVYWANGSDWSYADSALEGSSHLKLPQPLQFFTGNIGLHHVHHLSAKVPNYHLQAAHDNCDVFADVPVLTIREGMRSTNLKLIDDETGRLVTFRQARAITAARSTRPMPVTA
jgi:omega-6 fatty acid desaturase (delta-12 desaturase)